jgi:hypothetical protein
MAGDRIVLRSAVTASRLSDQTKLGLRVAAEDKSRQSMSENRASN